MKLPFIASLAVSHIAAASIGWLLFQSTSGKTEMPDGRVKIAAAVKTQPRTLGNPTSPNPIFRATSSDFRIAWMDLLRQGRRPDTGFFLDWCEVDPEAAILGLRYVWAPDSIHNYLNNATNGKLAATLAEPLIKHWKKFHQIRSYKLSRQIALSLRALAQENPERSSGLLFMLPAEIRKDVYGSLFKSAKTHQLMVMAETITSHDIPTSKEAQTMWSNLISAISHQSTVSETLDLSTAFKSDDAMTAMGPILVNKATRFDQWDALISHPQFNTQGSLIKQAVGNSLLKSYQSRSNMSSVLAACAKANNWSLLENMPTPTIPDHLHTKKIPDQYLEWLVTHGDSVNGDTATRIAIRLALNASLKDTLEWVSKQPAGRARDLAHVEAIKTIAYNKNQDIEVARKLAESIQDKSLRAEAERMLGL